MNRSRWVRGKNGALCDRLPDAVWCDRIYRDTYASIGLAAAERSPVAFLSKADRYALLGKETAQGMARFLPEALTLSEAAAAIAAAPEV